MCWEGCSNRDCKNNKVRGTISFNMKILAIYYGHFPEKKKSKKKFKKKEKTLTFSNNPFKSIKNPFLSFLEELILLLSSIIFFIYILYLYFYFFYQIFLGLVINFLFKTKNYKTKVTRKVRICNRVYLYI